MVAKAKMNIRFEYVNIRDIEESPINPNVQKKDVFDRLVANIKKDKQLTSAVLLTDTDTSKKMCISGHHRIRAALKCGLLQVPALIINGISESERIRLQISHNDIHGEQDKELLFQLTQGLEEFDWNLIENSFSEISRDVESSQFENVEYAYIKFTVLPDTKRQFEWMIEEIEKNDEYLTIIDQETYEKWKELLTIAFRSGYKTNGRALRKFINIVDNHREELK